MFNYILSSLHFKNPHKSLSFDHICVTKYYTFIVDIYQMKVFYLDLPITIHEIQQFLF